VFVNATTLVVGGGIQVGISFIEYASRSDSGDVDFLFTVSRPIYDSFPTELQNDSRVHLFDVSPARILRGHKSRSVLKQLEREFRPDLIYTLGLPSYTRFRSPEVGRYTNPWEIFPTPLAWSSIPIHERITVFVKCQYRLFWARRASFFETQTEAAKSGIARRLNIPTSRIKVVPNAPNPIFFAAGNTADGMPPSNQVNIFCLAAAYRHKNLGIIPEVADCLKRLCPDKKFNFIITLPQRCRLTDEILEKSRRLGVSEMINNVGTLKLTECIHWYQKSDIILLPTLLEVFSATYVEAMAMQKPIITSDLDFARSVCGDAALYYDPQSAQAAAEAVMAIVSDGHLQAELVERGRIQLKTFPEPERKHQMIIEWLGELAQGHRY